MDILNEIEGNDDELWEGEMTDIDKMLAAMTPEERERVAAEDLLQEKMLWRICHLYRQSRTNHLGHRWAFRTAEGWLKVFPELTSTEELEEQFDKLKDDCFFIQHFFTGARQIGVCPTEDAREMVKTWTAEPSEPWVWGE